MKELRSYSLIVLGTLILGISYNAFLIPAKVQLRTSTSKLVLIVTDQEDAVKALIHDEIDRGITKLWSEGGYSKQ